MRFKNVCPLPVLFILLCSCATQYYYFKDGLTQGQFEREKANCVTESYQKLPVQMTSVTIGSATQDTTCKRSAFNDDEIKCRTTQNEPTAIPYDVNEKARDYASQLDATRLVGRYNFDQINKLKEKWNKAG